MDDLEKHEAGIKYFFSIGYHGKEENKRTHERFKEFSYRMADDSYIVALKFLLDFWESQQEMNALWDSIDVLKVEVESLKQKGNETVTKGIKTFGDRGE